MHPQRVKVDGTWKKKYFKYVMERGVDPLTGDVKMEGVGKDLTGINESEKA
jgi:hypothetical protein